MDLERFRNRFDLVICYELINHLSQSNTLERPITVYTEIAKSLAPGGVAIAPSNTLFYMMNPDSRHQRPTNVDIIGVLGNEDVEIVRLEGDRYVFAKRPVSNELRTTFANWRPNN